MKVQNIRTLAGILKFRRSTSAALICFRYVVVVVEAIAVVSVSSAWRVLSFKHTHLVERNGTLTLVILGEGIVGLCKSVTQVMGKSKRFTDADVGTITAGILLVVSTRSSYEQLRSRTELTYPAVFPLGALF